MKKSQVFAKHRAVPVRQISNLTNALRENESGQASNEAHKIVAKQIAATVATHQATDYLFKCGHYMGVVMPPGSLLVKIRYACYSFVVNMLGTIYLPLGFVLSYLTMSAEELEIGNLLTSLQVTFDVYGGSIKLIIMTFMLVKLRAANAIMAKLDKRCREQDEIAELHKVIRFGRNTVYFFATIFLSYSGSTFLGSVVMGHPPYSLYFPFLKWRRSQTEFVLASVLEFVMMDFACLQQIVNDAYGVIYVSILRAHMKILLLRVQKMSTNAHMTLEQNYEELKACIKDHQNLLKLFDTIAPIVSITIFIQFMITAAILGTTLINIMIFATELSSRVASCFYILAVVVEIFPICYYSQCLIDDSNRLANVIFHSNWVDQSPQYRKMLIFFMQRSQMPLELTAGKLFPVTLNSFVSIAKFSFSLFTFIEKMNIKERLGLE